MKFKLALIAVTGSFAAANMASALTVIQTTASADLSAALGGGGGLAITSATVVNGASGQFGTYSGFTSPPVTIGDGVVMSTGQVAQVIPTYNNGAQGTFTTPSTDMGVGGTTEFNAYGPGHISNFISSNDVAALQVSFSLAAASQIGFSFIFGSAEFPQYTSNFTDAFLVFLDGKAVANQIVFDPSNNAVQVGNTFSSALTKGDTNTAFANPHGLLELTTFTASALTAGNHTLWFEVADVNDHILDSGVFITNLHAGSGTPGTNVPDSGTTASLLGLAMLGLAGLRRKLNLA
ncbi:MAG: VPDSG-CTERM sorting domain-containing protein [Verrucomicrobiota bacterium]